MASLWNRPEAQLSRIGTVALMVPQLSAQLAGHSRQSGIIPVLEILPGACERGIQPAVEPVFDSFHTIQLYARMGNQASHVTPCFFLQDSTAKKYRLKLYYDHRNPMQGIQGAGEAGTRMEEDYEKTRELSEFIDAAKKGDLATVDRLLSGGISLDASFAVAPRHS